MAAPLGSTPGIIVGVGVGTAVAAALEPAIELPKQDAWKRNPNRTLDPNTMARLVAQGGVELGAAHDVGERHGLTADKIDALVYLAQRVPAVGEALVLWRRDLISDTLFEHVLVREGFDQRYVAGLAELKQDLLDPAQLAAAIHRGLIPDPAGLLKGEQPSPPYNVERYPVYQIDALKEAAGSGYNHDRLGVLVGLQGLPMGPHEAAQALFRGVITKGDYITAFNESNNRNEWAEAILAQSRQIPTARDFLENALRGYRTQQDAFDGAALHGMSEEHANLIYQNQGRPMNIRQITQAMAWGAKFNPEPGEIKDPYHASIVEGPVKPGYYELAEALKYNLPSAFFLSRLQTSGALTQAQARMWYLRLGWPPELADDVSQHFAQGATAKGQGETQSELADEYIAGFITETEYRAALTGMGLTGHEQDLEVLHAEIGAIKTARGAQVTKLRNAYDKGEITQAVFSGSLAALGLHDIAVQKEVEYANIYRSAVGITG